MNNLKEIKIVVKTLVTKTFIVNEENGYNMPTTIQGMLDFVESVKDEALNYPEGESVEIDSQSQIESFEIIEDEL